MGNIDYVAVIGFILMIVGIGLILFLVIIKLALLWCAKRERRVNKKSFELLFTCIDQGNLDEMSIHRIFKSRNEELNSIFFNYDFSFERFLDSFLISSIKRDLSGTYRKEANEIINPILQRIKDKNPYSNVNERERRILLSIEDTTKKSTNLVEGEKAAIKHNLEDLAMALEENQNTLKKSKKSNRLAWLGILITVIFGIISIILYFI